MAESISQQCNLLFAKQQDAIFLSSVPENFRYAIRPARRYVLTRDNRADRTNKAPNCPRAQEVDHLAPARTGVPVVVHAEVVGVRGRRLMFRNTVHQGETLVMEGFRHRSVVRMQTFSSDDDAG